LTATPFSSIGASLSKPPMVMQTFPSFLWNITLLVHPGFGVGASPSMLLILMFWVGTYLLHPTLIQSLPRKNSCFGTNVFHMLACQWPTTWYTNAITFQQSLRMILFIFARHPSYNVPCTICDNLLCAACAISKATQHPYAVCCGSSPPLDRVAGRPYTAQWLNHMWPLHLACSWACHVILGP
jgi:hypothetical protein